jgi:phospholipid/cholesterol/gamma-HCH transport system permease protein
MAMWSFREGHLYVRECLFQATRVIARTIVPTCAMRFPFGMIIGLQGYSILDLFGAHITLPSLLAIMMLREVAPVMTGVMLALQAGSGAAGELGTMQVKQEIDATEIMAVDPVAFHVLPRMFAIVVTGPVLFTIGGAIGLVGGYVAVVGDVISHGTFMSNLWTFLTLADVWGGVAKALAFGLIVAVVCCYEGFYSGRGARGVGAASNRAVVTSVLLIVVSNYFLSSAIYGALQVAGGGN